MVRANYPLTRERVYLNTAGLGPASYPALEAARRTAMELQIECKTGHNLMKPARERAAAFLGADPEEIAFVRNATEGNATIANGLDLRPSDEVVFESHAHPGGSFAWLNKARRGGIVVKVFEPVATSTATLMERLEAQVTSRTRVIQVSHITAPTGILMPIEEIAAFAKARGIWFHIDGAQSAGAIPVDLHALGCDSYATSGHKWLGAPHGTGLLYVRKDRLDDVEATEVGAYSGEFGGRLPGAFVPGDDATRFEPGTRDVGQIVGIQAAVEFMERIGMERARDHGTALAVRLHRELEAIPGVEVITPSDPALRASITAFKSDRVGFIEMFGRLLRDYKLRCRPVSEEGLDANRASFHVFNNEGDVDELVAAVRAIHEAGE